VVLSTYARNSRAGKELDMIWAILLLVGVPLWLCAAAIGVLILRNRSLRKRAGNVPARLRAAPGKRWTRGHGLWVHDVWAFRGSPAAWSEKLVWVSDVAIRRATADETEKLRGLGENPTVAVLAYDGGTMEVATSEEHRAELIGPFVSRISMSELDATEAESPSSFPTPNNQQGAPRP
jgi:hypothetical protein